MLDDKTFWCIFFCLCYKTNADQENRLFCVNQSSTSNNVLFNIFINDIYNGIFSIGSLIYFVNPDTIEDYMNGVLIIVSNEQLILMILMNHLPITICNNFEANKPKGFSSNKVESRLDVSYFLIQNTVGNCVIVKMSHLRTINCVDASA